MARKTKYNPDLHIPMIFVYAKNGYIIKEIAKEFNVSEDTIYNWFEDDPKFRLSWEDGKANCVKFVESQLHRLCTPHVHKTIIKDGRGQVTKIIEKDIDPSTAAISLYLRLKDETARKALHQDINIINQTQIDEDDKDL